MTEATGRKRATRIGSPDAGRIEPLHSASELDEALQNLQQRFDAASDRWPGLRTDLLASTMPVDPSIGQGIRRGELPYFRAGGDVFVGESSSIWGYPRWRRPDGMTMGEWRRGQRVSVKHLIFAPRREPDVRDGIARLEALADEAFLLLAQLPDCAWEVLSRRSQRRLPINGVADDIWLQDQRMTPEEARRMESPVRVVEANCGASNAWLVAVHNAGWVRRSPRVAWATRSAWGTSKAGVGISFPFADDLAKAALRSKLQEARLSTPLRSVRSELKVDPFRASALLLQAMRRCPNGTAPSTSRRRGIDVPRPSCWYRGVTSTIPGAAPLNADTMRAMVKSHPGLLHTIGDRPPFAYLPREVLAIPAWTRYVDAIERALEAEG